MRPIAAECGGEWRLKEIVVRLLNQRDLCDRIFVADLLQLMASSTDLSKNVMEFHS